MGIYKNIINMSQSEVAIAAEVDQTADHALLNPNDVSAEGSVAVS